VARLVDNIKLQQHQQRHMFRDKSRQFLINAKLNLAQLSSFESSLSFVCWTLCCKRRRPRRSLFFMWKCNIFYEMSHSISSSSNSKNGVKESAT